MLTEVIMPQLGESVVEGTVTRWLVEEGDRIEKFAPLLEVATDKVDTEVPSPASGVLLKIYVPAGQTVAAGTLVAAIGAAGDKAPELTSTGTDEPVIVPEVSTRPEDSTTDTSGDLGFISPVVAKLAAEHDIDLQQVTGTGLRGRIRKVDVLAHLRTHTGGPHPLEAELPVWEQPGSGDLFKPTAPFQPSPSDPDPLKAAAPEIVPLNRMRRLIAEHMVQSKRISPHVTTVFDCDLTNVVRHRYTRRQEYERHGITLTLTPYFIAAIVAALKQHPWANSSWSEEGILLHRRIHVGMAVAVEDGLVVPVIHDADGLNLFGLARAVNDLAQRARAGKLKLDDLQGGTFTLTNHGTSGSLFATPIINQPQTGILGVGKVHKEPVVISRGHALLPDADDTIAIRPLAYLSFTFDHRVLDGATADAFVAAVKGALERWADD